MKNQHDFPIYLYARRYVERGSTRFSGDLCFGRKPTDREERNAEQWIRESTCYMGLEPLHFICGVYPTLEARELRPVRKRTLDFYSIDELLDRAISVYTEQGYTSGLVLGWDGKNPPADKVLILPKGCYSEKEFLARARKLHRWGNWA